MDTWQIHEARSHLSQLLDKADEGGPQIITDHGRPRSVVLSFGRFQALNAKSPDLKTFLLGSPKIEGGFEVTRDPSTDERNTDL